MSKNPKYRRPINKTQIHTLKLTFKFRFVTAPLLVSVFKIKKSRQSVYQTLEILLAQDYVGKLYDSSYRIMGKQARYYLRPKAVRLLSDELKLDDGAQRAVYQNRSLSPAFVRRMLDTIKVYVSLRDNYPETFHIFARVEQGRFDYFPNPRPDLYLNRIKPIKNRTREYMLDVFTETPLFAIRKRIDAYMEHYDEGEWEAATDSDYPVILVVARDSRQEKQLQRYIARKLEYEGLDGELTFYTASLRALLDTENKELAIWRDVMEPKAHVSLGKV